jgi:hypothetical protein
MQQEYEHLTAHRSAAELWEEMNMDDIEEVLVALRVVYANLEQLRLMDGPEFLLPGRVDAYHRALEDAYVAYNKVETTVDQLGQQLEAEHAQLDAGVKKYGEPG